MTLLTTCFEGTAQPLFKPVNINWEHVVRFYVCILGENLSNDQRRTSLLCSHCSRLLACKNLPQGIARSLYPIICYRTEIQQVLKILLRKLLKICRLSHMITIFKTSCMNNSIPKAR
jgi:hypothetical protein